MIEIFHSYGVTVMKLQHCHVRIFQCRQLETCLDYRPDPYIILGADIPAPYAQAVNLGIMKIRPLPVIENRLAVLDIFNRIECLHQVFTAIADACR